MILMSITIHHLLEKKNIYIHISPFYGNNLPYGWMILKKVWFIKKLLSFTDSNRSQLKEDYCFIKLTLKNQYFIKYISNRNSFNFVQNCPHFILWGNSKQCKNKENKNAVSISTHLSHMKHTFSSDTFYFIAYLPLI